MVQFQFAVERHVVRREALAAHHIERLRAQGLETCVDLGEVQLVQRAHQETGEVLAHVGVQHPDSAERTRIAGHIEAIAAEARGDRGTVHWSGASRSHHREPPRRVSPFDRDVLGCAEQVLFDDLDDACRCLSDRHAERFGHVNADCFPCCVNVEIQGAAGGLAGTQAAEDQLGIGDGRQCAAVSVAGWTGISAGALRSHVQQAGLVDSRDGPTTCADRVDVDGRGGDVIARDHDVVAGVHLAARHEQHIARGSPDLHRDEVSGQSGTVRILAAWNGILAIRKRRSVCVAGQGGIHGIAVQVQRADRGCGAAQQQVHGPLGYLIDRRSTTVRLHEQDRVTQSSCRELIVQRTQVGHDLR